MLEEVGVRVRTRGLAVLAVAIVSATGGSAEAKTFRVYTCVTPDERMLGATIDYPERPSGWSWSYTSGTPAQLRDECSSHGMFVMEVQGAAMAGGQGFGGRWNAPPGTTLAAVSLRWTAELTNNPARGEGAVQLTLATDRTTLFALSSPGAVTATGPEPNWQSVVSPAQWFDIRFTCLDQCSPGAVIGRVVKAWFDVDDSSPPTGGLVGSATDAQTWSGVVRFGLNAADVGAGVFRAVVEVDGVDALSLPLGDAGGSCRDIGPSPAINEFAAALPCPLRIDAGPLDVDASALPQGRHQVRVLLEDAAGNRTAIFGPLTRNIAASGAIGPGSDPALRGAANGDGASDQARLGAHWGRKRSRSSLVSPFGRTHVVRGRLQGADGAPISGATIDVTSKTTAVNARELAKGPAPRTRNDGSWFMLLAPRVSSRDLTFRYRSHVNDTVPAATAGVRLRVRAGLALAIHPRVARRGQAIRFAGTLLGAPLPRGGKQVVLMARASRGAWVRFNVVRTGARGHFRALYRFQQPGAARYRFRALSLAEAAYPYLAGGSNVVLVAKR
jgi:hypothetical protein